MKQRLLIEFPHLNKKENRSLTWRPHPDWAKEKIPKSAAEVAKYVLHRIDNQLGMPCYYTTIHTVFLFLYAMDLLLDEQGRFKATGRFKLHLDEDPHSARAVLLASFQEFLINAPNQLIIFTFRQLDIEDFLTFQNSPYALIEIIEESVKEDSRWFSPQMFAAHDFNHAHRMDQGSKLFKIYPRKHWHLENFRNLAMNTPLHQAIRDDTQKVENSLSTLVAAKCDCSTSPGRKTNA